MANEELMEELRRAAEREQEAARQLAEEIARLAREGE
jgi:hypothetical protein